MARSRIGVAVGASTSRQGSRRSTGSGRCRSTGGPDRSQSRGAGISEEGPARLDLRRREVVFREPEGEAGGVEAEPVGDGALLLVSSARAHQGKKAKEERKRGASRRLEYC